MKYITIAALILLSIYPFSYAKHCWRKKNRMAAMGAILLTALSIILPVALMYRK